MKSLNCIVAACHLLVSILWVMPATSYAQADIDPPQIDMDAIDQGILGDKQVFSAVVTDDSTVATVLLHYRFDDELNYDNVQMKPIQGTEVYSVSLDTIGLQSNRVQYYVEAVDEAGNQTLRGFAFDPLERQLVPADTLTEAAPSDEAVKPGLSTSRKVLYGVLGLVVVGALAGASSGGGGGGGASGGAGAEIPLTIVVPGTVQ